MLVHEQLTEHIIGAAIEVHRNWAQGYWSQHMSSASVMNCTCEI
jgi:hypothetical protein